MPIELEDKEKERIEIVIKHFKHNESPIIEFYCIEIVSKDLSKYFLSKKIDLESHHVLTEISLKNMPEKNIDSFLSKLEEEVYKVTKNRNNTGYLLYFPINVDRPSDTKYHTITLGNRQIFWLTRSEFNSILEHTQGQRSHFGVKDQLGLLNWGKSNREIFDYSCLKIQERSELLSYAVENTYRIASIFVGLINLSKHARTLRIMPSEFSPHSKIIPPAACLCITEDGQLKDLYYYAMFPNDGEKLRGEDLKYLDYLTDLYNNLPEFKERLFGDCLMLFNYGVSELNAANAFLAFYRGFEIMTSPKIEHVKKNVISSIAGFFDVFPFIEVWLKKIRHKRNDIVHRVVNENVGGSEINILKYLYSTMLLYILNNKDLDSEDKLELFFEYRGLPPEKLERIRDVTAKILKELGKDEARAP